MNRRSFLASLPAAALALCGVRATTTEPETTIDAEWPDDVVTLTDWSGLIIGGFRFDPPPNATAATITDTVEWRINNYRGGVVTIYSGPNDGAM